ncbi:sinalpyl alcohol oxidase Nec3-like [Cornus florida]|uniref:sinalpyl alcohol oxidase Nec3-like n=1 Tax=Cornus florida TaxID=4283 RepID=UPI00289B9739|nr:sinalpyl alcohol oxidase Nec3-like [Cornus florida]
MGTLALHTIPFLLLSIGLQPGIRLATESDNQELNYLKFVFDATEFSSSEEYDYIVVGGGTAGCPLAATLSTNYSILLLERGGDAHDNPNVIRQERILLSLLEADDKDSPAQGFTSEDGIQNARARVLGGGSMINLGFYSRADQDFYMSSGIKWDMAVVNNSYEWVEESIVFRPILGSWQSSVKEALLESGVGPDNGFTLDHLEGTKIGGSIFDRMGRRHGAVELLNKAEPKNLRVAIHATVERLIFTSSKSLGLSAVGVIYRDSKGRFHEARVRGRGEVILSAGAIGSPQVLLLSGIGPKQYLSSMNITVVHHQPYVGQFMQDIPRNGINFVAPFAMAEAEFGSQVVGIIRDGTYVESLSGVIPFYSPAASPILFPDPSPPVNISVMTIVKKNPRPRSTGLLQLASPTNIMVSPIVRFNYFANPLDLLHCGNTMRNVGKMLRTRAMEQYKFRDTDGTKYFKFVGWPLPGNESDEVVMESFCRKTLTTYWHYHGGCLVGKVVDDAFRAIGINSLRIVDGSTFRVSPGTNPQATLMMLGRYVGLKMQEERMS